MDEFELIRRFFAQGGAQRDDVILGVGDDAAVLRVPSGCELVTSVDSLVAGVHFLPEMEAEAVGHRALAVNLSDLAAMGAEPAWTLLALTLPEADEVWLTGFSEGFFTLAKRFGVALVGGNTARGPLNITVTVNGFVPQGKALTRNGSEPGDLVYVTGCPGEAAAGLELLKSRQAGVRDPRVKRFAWPEPRIEAGLKLRGLASACIDISDGLLADLGHLLEARRFGAKIGLDRLPLPGSLLEEHGRETAWNLALTGGDDYELCFTVHADKAAIAEARLKGIGCPATCIGAIEGKPGIECVDSAGRSHAFGSPGYRHF